MAPAARRFNPGSHIVLILIADAEYLPDTTCNGRYRAKPFSFA